MDSEAGKGSSSFSIPGTPMITPEKLNGKNYLAWSSYVELWFLGQGQGDHLKISSDKIPDKDRSQWEKLDYQLCALLRQSVEPNISVKLRNFKTCYTFWEKARSVIVNDIQLLYDAVEKLVDLKQIDHDMVSYVTEAQCAVEELKLFLEADTIEGIKAKLDNLYVVLVLRGTNPDFEHVRDQVLSNEEVPSVENLINRLLQVPSPRVSNNSTEPMEISAMVYNCKRMGHTQKTCYSLHGSAEKSFNVSKTEILDSEFSNDEYQEYLQLKAAQQSQASTIAAHNSIV